MKLSAAEYVTAKWAETVRYNPNDEGTLIGLPHKYTVPTINGCFNELYYWDTYFTNLGLIADGKAELAVCNCKNMLFLVDKFGYMPNGSRTYYLGRSQPPYLARMVLDAYFATGDLQFLRTSYDGLVKEYGFWASKRSTVTGLSRHYNEHSDNECIDGFSVLTERVKSPFTDAAEGGRQLFAEAESGWDFSPRFGGRCADFNPVDLNCNLFVYERVFAFIERELKLSNGAEWESKAQTRRKRINSLCYNAEKGYYSDYDFKSGKTSEILSAAAFWPYFCGVAEKENVSGLQNALKGLEAPFGVLTALSAEQKYQWGYPNVWAPCLFASVSGCLNYGLTDCAERLAQKYISLIENNYEQTGGLWEKYNAIDGTINCANEYEMPQMMGWTAGVYKCLKNNLKTLESLKIKF